MVEYTFVYIKETVEYRTVYTFDSEPTLEQVNQQMASYNPDQTVDYIRN